MSLYKDASLAMIPSAYKDGKLYSIRPTDGSGDFTFSRGSNLAATRVDVNGLIEKGRENVLTYSNQFDTTWSKTLSSVIGNQSGYNGSNDAWKMISGASGTYSIVSQNYSGSGVHTLSLYAKAAEWNYIALFINGSGGASKGAIFDLTTGELTNTIFGSPISYSSNSIGDGWWRLSVTLTGTITGANIYLCEVGTSHTSNNNDGSSGIYIQDAQLEQGLVATDYIETGASTAQAGILEDMPRLDYSGGASCPSLLLEPQRSNLVTYSEYFENYTKYDSSVTSNGAISPEGLKNATKLFDGTGSTQHYIGNVGVGYFTNTDIRGTSVFVKAGTLDYMQLRIGNITGDFSYYLINVNLNDGSVSLESSGGTTNHSNSVEDYGNGWYRVSMACSFTNSNVTGSRTEIYTAKNNSHTYTGTGTDYILIYGAQAESGSYPTSYIPTYGSSVTRSADDLGNILLPEFNDENNYSVMFDLTRKGIDTSLTGDFFEFRRTDFARMIRFWIDAPNAQVRFRSDQESNATMSTVPFAADATKKICVVYDGDTFKTFADGSLVGTYNVVNAMPLSRLYMTSKSFDMNQLVIFKTSLTDAEAIALTA